jgi:hypothetical protein
MIPPFLYVQAEIQQTIPHNRTLMLNNLRENGALVPQASQCDDHRHGRGEAPKGG